MIEVKSISASYGKGAAKVLDNIFLTVNDGEIVSIIGANGAGKSTILRVISGLIKPLEGCVEQNGVKLPSNPVDVVKQGIVMVPEGRKIFPSMSIYDNLRVGGYLRKRAELSDSIQEMYDIFPILGERRNQMAGTLSGGEQQMLAIARGLMAKPKVMLLDEPSLGLAPRICDEVFDLLQKLNREKGITMLLVEQNAALTFEVSDRVYVLEIGKMICSGSADEIKNNKDIVKAYLGV